MVSCSFVVLVQFLMLFLT